MWGGFLALPVRLAVIGLAAWWLYRERRLGRITIVRQHVLLVLYVLVSGWVFYPLSSWVDGDSWAVSLRRSGTVLMFEVWAIPLVGVAAYAFTKAAEQRSGERDCPANRDSDT